MVKAAGVYQEKHPRGLDIKPYENAEAEAKKEMKGVWSLYPDMRISYKDWREIDKK